MQLGTQNFEAYNRTLRRILWADFIDEQLRVARENQYRASLVDKAYSGQPSLAAAIGQHRTERRDT